MVAVKTKDRAEHSRRRSGVGRVGCQRKTRRLDGAGRPGALLPSTENGQETVGEYLADALRKREFMMDWSADINWFAIHAKRFREAVASSSVAALGLEVFLPMVKVECHEHLTIKVDSKPLFQGYFFARFNADISLGAVECARG